MRPIHLASMDKIRPVVVLTRETVRPYLSHLTVATITPSRRGLTVEVPVGRANGLNHESVISCDNVTMILVTDLREQVGFLLPSQEHALADALSAAFDLE
jgi:mRNA interferase MazF